MWISKIWLSTEGASPPQKKSRPPKETGLKFHSEYNALFVFGLALVLLGCLRLVLRRGLGRAFVPRLRSGRSLGRALVARLRGGRGLDGTFVPGWNGNRLSGALVVRLRNGALSARLHRALFYLSARADDGPLTLDASRGPVQRLRGRRTSRRLRGGPNFFGCRRPSEAALRRRQGPDSGSAGRRGAAEIIYRGGIERPALIRCQRPFAGGEWNRRRRRRSARDYRVIDEPRRRRGDGAPLGTRHHAHARRRNRSSHSHYLNSSHHTRVHRHGRRLYGPRLHEDVSRNHGVPPGAPRFTYCTFVTLMLATFTWVTFTRCT